MNRYMLICRLRGPAYILLTGVIALLAEWHILGWGKSWPLYLILAGVLKLAERAALASMDQDEWSTPPYGYPQGSPAPASSAPTAPAGAQSTAIVPSIPENHSGEQGR